VGGDQVKCDGRFSIVDCEKESRIRFHKSKMNQDELKRRTKQFALRVMNLVDALSRTTTGRAIGGQLVRAGTSVGANYRAACRGRSKAEFAANIFTAAAKTSRLSNQQSRIENRT